jgi:hypothetical protein
MNKGAIKRFTKEINLIQNSYPIIIDNNMKFHVLLPNIGKITFELTSYYPFKMPNILVNAQKYELFLSLKSNKLRNIYKLLFSNNCCMICDSYNCSGNWSPVVKIQNIINEIINMKNKMIQCGKYYLIEQIKKKNNIPIEINIFIYINEIN